MTKGRGGRKSKYTPEVVQRLVAAIELGATYELAAQAAGVDYATFARWVNEKDEFRETVKLAEGKSALAALAIVQRAAAERDWQAAAWLLERRHGYTRPAPVIQAGQVGVTLRIEWTREWRQIGAGIEQVALPAAAVTGELPPLDLPEPREVVG